MVAHQQHVVLTFGGRIQAQQAQALADFNRGLIVQIVLDELERRNLKRALCTLCVGGGMGIATIIERVYWPTTEALSALPLKGAPPAARQSRFRGGRWLRWWNSQMVFDAADAVGLLPVAGLCRKP
mgnify:CR=1 FL=1